MPDTASPLTHKIADVLGTFTGVKLALMFGSRATGKAREDSDLDLAIDAPGVDRAQIAARVSEALGLEVDVVSLNDVTIPLLRELIRDSQVVYEGARGNAASWRTRALCELETDGPWFDRMRDAWLRAVAARGLSAAALSSSSGTKGGRHGEP